MSRTTLCVSLFLATSGYGLSQGRTARSATVTVVAVNAWGTLDSTDFVIRSFVDEGGREWRDRFVKGRATGIPLGVYRLSITSVIYEDSEATADVNTENVLIRVGLDWLGVENDRTRAAFRGKIKGKLLLSRSDTCRASGVHLRRDYDSLLDPVTGAFDFGPVRTGTYVLTCVINKVTVVIAAVDISASTQDFSFEIPPNPSGKP